MGCMKEGRATLGNKYLMVVLGVLCVVVVVLMVLVIVNASKVGQETEKNANKENFAQGAVGEIEDARERAEELLDSENVSADDIIGFYSQYINKYIDEDNSSRVASYVWDRNDKLILGGFKQEALDVLLGMDLSAVGENDMYRQYANIVVLARDLGLNDVAAKYYDLLIAGGRNDESINVMVERNRALDQKIEEGNLK